MPQKQRILFSECKTERTDEQYIALGKIYAPDFSIYMALHFYLGLTQLLACVGAALTKLENPDKKTRLEIDDRDCNTRHAAVSENGNVTVRIPVTIWARNRNVDETTNQSPRPRVRQLLRRRGRYPTPPDPTPQLAQSTTATERRRKLLLCQIIRWPKR